jgi:hypothetical protein
MAKFKRGDLITSIDLRKIDACDWQIRKFRKEWPDGAKLLKKNLLRAAELDLNLDFFAHAILAAGRFGQFGSQTRSTRMDYYIAKSGRIRSTQRAWFKDCAKKLWNLLPAA